MSFHSFFHFDDRIFNAVFGDKIFEDIFEEFGRGFKRRFYTKEERIAFLEKYKKKLEKELQGVNEEIERLKKTC